MNDIVKFEGNWNHPYAAALKTAYETAIESKDKLPEQYKTRWGMSGRKYRGFANSLIENLADARYLEIGSYTGSTACAAIWGNKLKALCIDNWSQFGGPKTEFQSNIDNCLKDSNCDFSFIEQDFRQVDYNSIGKFNVYFYDGPHEEQDQYDGLKIVQPALDDVYVLIVDDYNHENVIKGTARALEDLKPEIIASVVIETPYPGAREQNSDWHAGYYISVVKK